LVLGNIEASKFNTDEQFDDFLIPFMDELSGCRWCRLEGNGLGMSEQFSEKRTY